MRQADIRRLRFYKTAPWIRTREYVLARDRHLCLRCMLLKAHGLKGKVNKAEEVHHIDELEDGDDFIAKSTPDNLVSLCHECHNHITSISHGYGGLGRMEFDENGDAIEIKEPEQVYEEDSLFWGKGKSYETIADALGLEVEQ